MVNKLFITREEHKRLLSRLLSGLGDFTSTSLEGAKIFALILAEKLEPGYYKVEYPEMGLTPRMLLTGADKMHQLIQMNNDYSFEVYTSNAAIATRCMFDEIYEIDDFGQLYSVDSLFGLSAGNNKVWYHTK